MINARIRLSGAELEAAQQRTMHNRSSLRGRCACYDRRSSFLAERICQRVDNGQTALCPVCGIDAVLSSATDPISVDSLEQLHDRWLGSTATLSQADWDQSVAEEQLLRPPP